MVRVLTLRLTFKYYTYMYLRVSEKHLLYDMNGKRLKQNSNIFALSSFRRNIAECRSKLYVFVSLWKIGLILASMTLFMYLDDYEEQDLWDIDRGDEK